jgi:uncharacterized membrane protein
MIRSTDEEPRENLDEDATVSSRFLLLLISGFVLLFVGIAVILIATVFYGGGSASAGVVIFIGPFPIVIGAGPDATLIVLISIIIAVLSVVVFLVLNRKVGRFED